jgi:hypothetical protein
MGTNISSESGYVFDIKAMVKLLRKTDVKAATEACTDFYCDLGLEAEQRHFKALAVLVNWKTIEPKKVTLDQLKKALVKTTKPTKKKEWDHGEYCKHLNEHAEQHQYLWEAIIGATRPDFPARLYECCVFESGRINGWNVPIGEMCFLMDGDFWTKTMTEDGKTFKKLMGKCEEVKWTTWSY